MKSGTMSPTMTFFSAAVWARDFTNKRQFLKGISVALLHQVDCRSVVKMTQIFLSTYQARL